MRGDLFELIERPHKEGIALRPGDQRRDRTRRWPGACRGEWNRVSVSLDGTTAEVHNKLRRQEGSFEAAVEGMERLREEGVPFQINMTMTRYNAHQPDELFEFARRAGAAAVHLFMLVPVGCGEEFDEADMLSADEYEELLRQVARRNLRGLEVKVTCRPHYERIIREQGGSHRDGCPGAAGGLGVCS